MSEKSTPITAREIMMSDVTTLRPEMDVYEAIDLLLEYRFSGAPVVDAEGNLVGILSEKDCMRVLLEGTYEGLPTATVNAFMQRNVCTITEEMDLLSIAHIFLSTSYRRLPVVRGKKVVGQVSRRDLLNCVSGLLRASPERHASYLYLSMVSDRNEAPIS